MRLILIIALVSGCSGGSHTADATSASTGPAPSVTSEGPAASDDEGPDGQTTDPTVTTASTEPFDAPRRILFIGNSFTLGGSVPELVELLAADAGWTGLDIHMRAVGGETLEGHRGRPETVDAVDAGAWDALVLQEFSTRPTDNLGDPEQYKTDATWFHDRVQQSSAGARVVLYETWARHPDHSYYPDTFTDPAEMQAQLRHHIQDAADHFIPTHAAATLGELEVAPAGDAWEIHLGEPDPLRLHASDDYHAAAEGQYLNGLVLYATLFRRSVLGRTPWHLAPDDAARLQRTVDALTGHDDPGGPDGDPPLGLVAGERVRIDLGSADDTTLDPGWNNLTDDLAGNLRTDAGAPSTVDLWVHTAFGGTNTVGLDTTLYPPSATRDSLFCGSFDDHEQGLAQPAAVELSDLDPAGRYTVHLFASRAGDDDGRGRLTRYAAGGRWVDLEVADNTTEVATLTGLAPDSEGHLLVHVEVSPDGEGRFCYLGVLEVVRAS